MNDHRSYFKDPPREKPKPKGLARGGPLKRTGQLRSTGQLQRTGPIKPGKSTKARRDDRTFKAGERSEICPRCKQREAVDGSHRAPRSQRPDLRGDQHNRDDLCRPCHEWVEANPIKAADEGWRDGTRYELANPDPWSKLERQANQ